MYTIKTNKLETKMKESVFDILILTSITIMLNVYVTFPRFDKTSKHVLVRSNSSFSVERTLIVILAGGMIGSASSSST